MKAIFQTAIVFFSMVGLAHAQSDVNSSALSIDEITLTDTVDPRYKLFMGVGLGYSDNNGSRDTEGYPKQFKVDGSYSATTYPLVFDLGLGMSNQNFTTRNKSSASGLLFEAAGRYRAGNGYQVGPVLHTLINQGDNYGAFGNNAVFMGVQGLREFIAFNGRYNIRLGAKLMTDINVRGNNNVGMLEAAFGFPIFQQTQISEATTVYEERPLTAHDTELVATPAITTVKRDLRRSVMRFNLSDVKEEHKIFTRHLERTLKNNSHLFGSYEKRGNEIIFHNVKNEVALTELLKSVQ